MQEAVLVVSLLAILAVAALFVLVIRESGPGEPGWSAPEAAARLRGRILAGAILLGAVISVATLVPWPHAVPTGPHVTPVHVRASLWAWDLDRTAVRAQVPVVFHATSDDVNHGFAVYDPNGRLLFQTQAMPGRVNKVAWTFGEPGIYTIRCLEYCGLVHHGMIAEFAVEAAS